MVKIAVGTMGRTPFALTESLSTPEQFEQFFATCKQYSVAELDSARIYGGGESERIMSEAPSSHDFATSTKIGILKEGSLKRDAIFQSANKSLQDLRVQSVDIFYIHRPDRETPMEESLMAIDDLYNQGKFKRFGICGYTAKELKDLYNLCKEKEYVLPTVYQGSFNPVGRLAEEKLFPTLLELNIAFYAYAPLAGGLLIKPVEELVNAPANSRFGALPFVGGLYLKEPVTSQVKFFQETCKKESVPPLNAVYRWFLHHSALGDQDALIIGASSVSQLEANLKATRGGPLSETMVNAFESLWQGVKVEAASYHH